MAQQKTYSLIDEGEIMKTGKYLDSSRLPNVRRAILRNKILLEAELNEVKSS